MAHSPEHTDVIDLRVLGNVVCGEETDGERPDVILVFDTGFVLRVPHFMVPTISFGMSDELEKQLEQSGRIKK